MSSRDFPGPSWQDNRPTPDDRFPGYRPGEGDANYDFGEPPYHPRGGRAAGGGDGRRGYAGDSRSGQPGRGAQRQGGYGEPERPGYPGSAPRRSGGDGRGGRGEYRGNSAGHPRDDRLRYPDRGHPGNGPAGDHHPGNGSVPNGSPLNSGGAGRRTAQNGARGPGGRSLDDSAAWFRPSDGYDSTGYGIIGRRRAGRGHDAPGGDTGFGSRIRRGRRGFMPGGEDKRDPADAGRPPVVRFLLRIWRGRWWRRWTIKKAALILSATAALIVLALIASFFVMLSATKVPLVALSKPLSQSSVVYFSNGKVVGCFCSTDRTVLHEPDIKKSKLLVAAVLAAEDRSFFTEGGVSITGILRAAKADLSGNSLQGASTITEQFVKRYYDPSGLGNLTIGEKIKEVFVSIKLASKEPKWWILTHYLNSIPLGAGASGVEAAAETYFGRTAWQLTLGQAAMIAAMIQEPYGYQPTDPTYVPPGLSNSLLDRWVYVLDNMVRDGAITQQQMNQIAPSLTDPKADLKYFPKVKIRPPDTSWPGYRGYIMDMVVNELSAYYGYPASIAQLGNLGLQIHTTINQHLMHALYSAVKQNEQLMAQYGLKMPSYVNIASVLEKPGTGKIVAFYGGPGYGVKHCSWYHCDNNTILDAEPVGSSFKPYVLATAVSQGMNVQTSVMDTHSPLCIPPGDGNMAIRLQLAKQTTKCNIGAGYWLLNEPSENYSTNLPVAGATAVSSNPAFEDLIHRTTVQSVLDMAKNLGVSPADVTGLNDLFGLGCLKKFPNCHAGAVTAALGEGSLTAVDQANTFSDLVSGGVSVTPHIIDYIVQANGVRVNAHVVKTQALQPEVAGDVDYALSFDTSGDAPGNAGPGTGYPNAVWQSNRPMINKTGTLGTGANASQAWFIGAIPQYSLSVGVFTNRPNGNPPQVLDILPTVGGMAGGYGGAWPAHIWQTFMSENFSNLPVRPLPPQGYTGTNPTFTKWIMALPPKKHHKKKTCKQQPGGPGGPGGPGNGHHNKHFGVQRTASQCQQKPSPGASSSPSPGASSSPSSGASSSPSPGPSSSPTPSPTPSPSSSAGVASPGPAKPGAPAPAALSAHWTMPAILPTRDVRRPAWAATTSLGLT